MKILVTYDNKTGLESRVEVSRRDFSGPEELRVVLAKTLTGLCEDTARRLGIVDEDDIRVFVQFTLEYIRAYYAQEAGNRKGAGQRPYETMKRDDKTYGWMESVCKHNLKSLKRTAQEIVAIYKDGDWCLSLNDCGNEYSFELINTQGKSLAVLGTVSKRASDQEKRKRAGEAFITASVCYDMAMGKNSRCSLSRWYPDMEYFFNLIKDKEREERDGM